MIERRPIRADEADAFLQLLCDVFELQFDRVRSVFFNEPFFDLNRKWGLFRDGELRSILTTTPLEFGWGRAIGIAGVATRESERGNGYAAQLLEATLEQAKTDDEGVAYLFAKDPRLYEAVGFQVLDDIVEGALLSDPQARNDANMLGSDEVRDRYDHWALEHDDRLRRDDRRWRYWKWNLRLCAEAGSGYVAQEGLLVREAIGADRLSSWPVPEEAKWSGLRSMTEAAGAPCLNQAFVTHFMGLGADRPPQLFLTDQF